MRRLATIAYVPLFGLMTACGGDDGAEFGGGGTGGTVAPMGGTGPGGMGGTTGGGAGVGGAGVGGAGVGGAAGVGGVGGTGGQPPGACSQATLGAGQTTTLGFMHGGQQRSYIIHVPPNIDVNQATPLLLNFHGLNSNAGQQQLLSGMDGTADKYGFVVAYPEGLQSSWNAGFCCGTSQANDADFARQVVNHIAQNVCVDRSRVYSTGLSNGGYMSEWNACKNADVFAAVAPVAGMAGLQTDCNPSRPVPMIALHGNDDPIVNYGLAQPSWEAWKQRNGCSGAPERQDLGNGSYCDIYSNCGSGSQVKLCTLEGIQHCWPGNPLKIPVICDRGGGSWPANDLIWQFLAQFTL